METNRAVIGVLIFILLIVGANFAMYAIARGAARSNNKGFLETLGRSLNTATRKRDDSMDELRRRVQELGEDKKVSPDDSE